jgi:two-component system, NtrC family, nitrogen regulation sensor histidine kinase GlnL
MAAKPDSVIPFPVLAADAVSDALPLPLLVVDAAYTIHYANAAAERLLHASATYMQHRPLAEVIALDDAWQALLLQAEAYHQGAKGYELPLHPLKGGEAHKVDVHIAACQPFAGSEQPGRILVLEYSAASDKLGSHANQRHAMRSAAVMAHILAHEVRNPLSGIKGAAQLLRRGAQSDDDRELLALIVSEVERIGTLMGQVEYFSTDRPLTTEALNIHEILRYVRDVAQQGFAAQVEFVEQYDPSLPPVKGNRELLVQALLNLVKNAAEAAAETGQPRITLRTAYRSGYRLSVPGTDKPVSLPICVQVGDNGGGIAEELRANIFDPFVTSKPTGKGLGLAVVAKVVADHGGVMALESAEPGNTVFGLQLPAAK